MADHSAQGLQQRQALLFLLWPTEVQRQRAPGYITIEHNFKNIPPVATEPALPARAQAIERLMLSYHKLTGRITVTELIISDEILVV